MIIGEKLLYRIKKQGHLEFPLRRKLVKDFWKRDSLWEHPIAATSIMLLCGSLDYVMFSKLFESILTDSVAIQRIGTIALLMGGDVAPLYIGNMWKKRKQGLNCNGMISAIFVTAFVLALTANVALRIVTRDIVLPDTSSLMAGTNPLAMPYAIFASVMPIITSLVSLGISYILANPLRAQMIKLQKEQIYIEDAIVKMEAVIMEYDSDQEHFTRLLKEDEQRYQTMLEMIHEKTVFYCDYVRERMKEKLGDPVSNNVLSKDNRAEILSILSKVS